ncbi:MAG TPA: hypothetical protein VLH79_13965 [Chthonomonadales bacterium]|nr:hypothetical protein [Chthonomonadales bacterium]
MDWSTVRGFNYQPSYGTTGLELWMRFDAATVDREIGLGKRYFPCMNALRIWLSWDAFKRDPAAFAAHFEQALAIADRYECVVMPVLFNRRHDATLDYGGAYIDHFLHGASWVQSADMFGPYLKAVVGAHAADPRIVAWDLCNEPFSYVSPTDRIPEIVGAEYAWLRGLRDRCRVLGAQAPITIGIHSGHARAGLEQVDDICDLLSIHPYWVPGGSRTKAEYERLLDQYVDVARRARKPIIASETCWGSLDDAARVAIIRYTLDQLRQRGIGWFAYLLHHSLIADAHRPEHGPVGPAGSLAFIEADGTLRPGHDAFNDY